jgi:hypothetical protein
MKVSLAQFCICVSVLSCLLICCGCGRKIAKLNELEGNAAGAIQKFLDLYEAENRGVQITNLQQVFIGAAELNRWHQKHPAFFQMQFNKFGKYAGFTNSFYEKYVRVPSGVTNPAFPTEPIFMNAQAFPNHDGRYGRMIIWRENPQYHRNNWVPEEQIQEAFKRAAIAIPQPTPMPKPPTPAGSPYPQHSLATRIELFFTELSGDYGPGRALWFPFMLICLGVPVVIGILITVWFARRSRPKEQ